MTSNGVEENWYGKRLESCLTTNDRKLKLQLLLNELKTAYDKLEDIGE